MTTTLRKLLWVTSGLAALFLAACPERPELDLEPPRVLDVEPAGPIVPVDVSFAVTFSEPLNERTLFRDDEGETVALVERTVASSAFVSDFDNPPLSESRKDDLLVVEVTLAESGDVVTVAPAASLSAGTAYALLVSRDVRDTSGNPLFGVSGARESFRFDFTTDDGPPALLGTDVGTSLVVPNRKYFTATFNQPVVGLSSSSFAIEPTGGAPTPAAESLLISAERDRATLALADGAGCERLAPDQTYQLRIGPGLADDEGAAMETLTVPFTTGPACDLVANALVGTPSAVATDVAATVRFSTTKASTTEVRFGIAGGALDCLGRAPCPVVGAPAEAPVGGSGAPRFLHSVALEDLTVDQVYEIAVRAEDETGSSATGGATFATAPLPTVAINEIMGNSPSVDELPDDFAGEYVEVANFGEASVTLTGWLLQKGDDLDATLCPVDGELVLEPGGFALLVGSGFQAAYYDVDVSKVRNVGTSSRLCGGLTNDSIQPLTLLDASERPVSTFAGYAHVDHDEDGRSVERTSPDAPDVMDSWCYSRTDRGPTPLAENGVTLNGCQ